MLLFFFLCKVDSEFNIFEPKLGIFLLLTSLPFLFPTIADTTTAAAPALQPLPKLGEVITATAETAIILAACHSLVVVEDADAAPAAGPSAAENSNVSAAEKAAMAASAANANLVGDPIELAAIKGAFPWCAWLKCLR